MAPYSISGIENRICSSISALLGLKTFAVNYRSTHIGWSLGSCLIFSIYIVSERQEFPIAMTLLWTESSLCRIRVLSLSHIQKLIPLPSRPPPSPPHLFSRTRIHFDGVVVEAFIDLKPSSKNNFIFV